MHPILADLLKLLLAFESDPKTREFIRSAVEEADAKLAQLINDKNKGEA